MKKNFKKIAAVVMVGAFLLGGSVLFGDPKPPIGGVIIKIMKDPKPPIGG